MGSGFGDDDDLDGGLDVGVQVADALLDYYDLGVTTFLIRGFDPLEDALDYGRELIPRTHALVAERIAAKRKAA